DSYTIGESVTEADRLPVQLVARLAEQGVVVDAPGIIARTGWTTRNLLAGIEQADPQGPYGLVPLLIAVTQQYQLRTTEEFRGELVTLLELAEGLADNRRDRIIVVSIPDWGVTPFADGVDAEQVATEIDAFNAILAEESASRSITFVDITPYSRTLAGDDSAFAFDGLHPSGAQYAGLVERVLPVAAKALGR